MISIIRDEVCSYVEVVGQSICFNVREYSLKVHSLKTNHANPGRLNIILLPQQLIM